MPPSHVIVKHENNVTVIEQRDEKEIDGESCVVTQKLESDLRIARQEWSEVSLKLGEMRKEKTTLSTRLRSKEEEIEQQLEKNNELRQQLRNAERIKRQQLDEVIVLQGELDKERQLRKEGNCTLLFHDLFKSVLFTDHVSISVLCLSYLLQASSR